MFMPIIKRQYLSDVIKAIKEEIKDIKRNYNPKDWDTQDVEDLEPAETYNRGWYRAMTWVLGNLKNVKEIKEK